MEPTAITLSPAPELQPAGIFAPNPNAVLRFVEFFTAQINNDGTRKADLHATRRFAGWCEAHGLAELVSIQAFHVAAFIKDLEGEVAPPTVKQHLAAVRMLFDWLVAGHVLEVNPAHAVRGPKYVVKKGKTPVLTIDEVRALLNSIAVVKTTGPDGQVHESADLPGLRDRALIGVMVYVRAHRRRLANESRRLLRAGAPRLGPLTWKGGKENEVPCHHKLEDLLDAYIAAAGLAGDPDQPLFQTAAGKAGVLRGKRLWQQQDAYRIIQRRAAAAGIETKIGNHTFRATGITAYLKNGGTLEIAQQIANHESPRTTKLYDRRQDQISLDEVERIAI